MRVAAVAVLLILGGCGPTAKPAAGGGDMTASLEPEILKWRKELVKTDVLCQSQVDGQKCVDFEVNCKALRDVTASDKTMGVTAHVVAAMDWTGWDPRLKQTQMGSATAEFTRTQAGWSRAAHTPVNMTTCADQ